MHSKSRVRSALAGPLEPYAAGFEAELARLGYTAAGTRSVTARRRWTTDRRPGCKLQAESSGRAGIPVAPGSIDSYS
jgi:hypothetical protein